MPYISEVFKIYFNTNFKSFNVHLRTNREVDPTKKN